MTEQEHSNVQWKKVKLGEVCAVNPKTDTTKVLDDDFVTFVRMEDVSNDGIIASFSERPYKSLLKKGFTIFQNDDVIFAKITPCMENGKGALVRNMKSKICMGSTEFHVLRACDNVSIDFIYQLTISKQFRQRAEMQMTGSAGQQRVPTAFLEDYLISIPFKNGKPDLAEQRRIAAILASADKVIAATQKTIAKYKQMKQGMMEDLLKPKDGWKKYEYKDVIIENRLGGNYENSTANIGYPVIKMGNIMRGYISLEKMQYLSFEKKYIADDVLKKGDLLFNTRNTLDLVGKVSIWNNELPFALYNSNLLRMKFDENIIGSNEFMNYYFNYHKTLMELRGFAIGTTSVAAIYGRDLDRLSIIVPSIKEQRRIATILSSIDAKIAAEEKVLQKYEKVKKGLMERLLEEE